MNKPRQKYLLAIFRLLQVILMLGCSVNSCLAEAALAQRFSIQTKDKKASLNLYIDWPDEKKSNTQQALPVLLVVPGTRDTSDLYMQLSHPDYTLDEDGMSGIGRKLNERGIVVVRFDQRGTVSPRVCLKKDAAPDFIIWLKHCWNNDHRRTVDFESWRADIVSVYQEILRLPNVDPQRIAVLGFSEGFIHAANVIGTQRLQAKSFVGIGAPAESPREIAMQQNFLRTGVFLLSQFKDEQQIIPVSDLEHLLSEKFAAEVDFPIDAFKPKTELTAADIRTFQAQSIKKYEATLEMISSNQRVSFIVETDGENHQVVNTYSYLKNLYLEPVGAVQALDELRDFKGDIRLYYGAKDKRVEIDRQLPIIKRAQKTNPHIYYEVFPGLEHGLQEQTSNRVPEFLVLKIADEIAASLRRN